MSAMRDICSQVERIHSIPDATLGLDAIILAAGFEDRAYKLFSECALKQGAHCILIRFMNNVPGNKEVFRKYKSDGLSKCPDANVHVIELKPEALDSFYADLDNIIRHLPAEVSRFGIDISGMPAHTICMVLKCVRERRASQEQVIFYTAAEEYIPSHAEYVDLIKGNPDSIELLPRSMALEMADNLVLDLFAGYRSQSAKSCLVVFTGYEVHRSTGVIDAINPALLLLVYGFPGDEKLSWRIDLSKKLHKKFERGRMAATEVVSTLSVDEQLSVLEEYYNYLIDDYDLVIAPIGSKMETLSSFLFWERYGEVQLTFPVPIGYDPSNRPRGSSATYQVTLMPRHPLYRDTAA